MKNVRNTRHALLTSLMALLLCFTMLLGTTYAWFTDSVTSTGNKIQAGTLKIDLELYDVDTGAFASIKESKAPIFDYELWEPGYTDVKLLKVENKGSLALKWKATLVGVDVNSILANVIDVYVLPLDASLALDDAAAIDELPADRTLAGYAPAGTLAEFIAGIETTTVGTLEAGKSAYLGIALKMQEDAGNEYQNLSLGTFDVQILATQLNAEKDSFDENYDANLDLEANGIEQVLADGSTVFYYDEASPNAGVVQLTKLPEAFTPGDEYVIPAEVNTLSGALANQHFSKLTIPAGVTYAKKSLQGTTIDEVVLEEGMTSIPDRMFYQTTVDTVTLPSSITSLEYSAFQQSNIKTITIPASVDRIPEMAFGGSTVETVIIEGNVTVEAYAFRGCSALADVYINGDDISFVNSTLRPTLSGCWFCRSESNNPGVSAAMTFHVKNETVAMKVATAMGVDIPQYTLNGESVSVLNVENISDLKKTLENATTDTIINITANITGDATAYQKENADLVINGWDNTLTGHLYINGRSAATSPETLTIKNLTITSDYYVAGGEYALINAYYDPTAGAGATRNVHNVTIENCNFIATGANAKAIPAIDLYQPFNITVKGCTVTGAHSAIQVKGGENITVDHLITADCKNGVSFGTNTNASISNSTIASVVDGGYGIRTDASDDYALSVKDCTISAFAPVLARKQTGTNYTLTLEGTNTLTATNDFGYQVILTETDWDNDSAAPTAPTGTYTLSGADAFAVFPNN